MKQKLTYFVSALVLVTFSLYLVPHEVVHVFYDHHDTEHSDADHNGKEQLSSIHIHCDFLSYKATHFINARILFCPEPVAVDFTVVFHVAEQPSLCSVDFLFPRGPPLG